MNQSSPDEIQRYLNDTDSWAVALRASEARSRRHAWMVTAASCTVAVLEAFALLTLAPLKTVEPYTLLVDRHTGYVEELKPIERQTIAPDAALTRSFLVQYVIAREGFDIVGVQSNYRKVALWSGASERSAYTSAMQANNPASPFVTLPRGAQVEVTIKSVSSLGPSSSMVRFQTRRTDQGGQALPARDWAATIAYRYSGAPMSAEDRLINPLGFEVIRYRRDPEIVPVAMPPVVTAPPYQQRLPQSEAQSRTTNGAPPREVVP